MTLSQNASVAAAVGAGGFSDGFGGRCGRQKIFEVLSHYELQGVVFDKLFGSEVGLPRTDDDGAVSENFLPIFFGGLRVLQVNDRFLPATGFKNNGASGVDTAHAKTKFYFGGMELFHEAFLRELKLRQRLVNGFGGQVVRPLQRINGRQFEAFRFPAGERHGEGKASALGIAHERAAGTPGEDGHAVNSDPTRDA